MPRGICDVSLEYTHIYFRGDLFPGHCLLPGRRLSHGALSRTPSAFYSRGAAPYPRALFGAPPRTPSAFLKESGAKNLLFFIWRVLLFLWK